MKQYTVQDATKQELIEFFFNPFEPRGVFAKDAFLAWLARKRTGELISTQEEAIEASNNALHEYLELVKTANNEPDIDKKLELFDRANKAYEAYEKAEKQYHKLDKKIMNSLGVRNK